MYDHFRIGLCAELVAGSLEFSAEREEVVNLSIKKDCQCPSFIPNRLASPWQINDAESPGARCKQWSGQQSFFIGSTVNDCAQHTAHDRLARVL
jgi:hypothetical protein